MKKLVLFVLALFSISIIFTKTAFANGAGLPPFFEINNKLSISNPLAAFGITASSFLLPQDFAPENYVVNAPVTFEINENDLSTVIPPEVMPDTKYAWDFGDGSHAEGIKNNHTYKKMGSYFLVLTIKVYTKDASIPTQFIDSFLINIVPDEKFKGLPQAVLKVNGIKVKQEKDPIKNRLDVDLNNSINLDASDSYSSSEIIEYLWDFGDGETASKKSVSHSYKGDYFDTIVLRVKDKNGFISDAFVNLRNTQADQKTSLTYLKIIIPIIIVILLIVIIFIIVKKDKKK